MRTSFSRRELYAMGEPIGNSATYETAGRRVCGGGGGWDPIGDIGDFIGDTVENVGEAFEDVGDFVGDVWMDVRDPLQAAAVAAGNYFLPGSGAITSHLVSDGAQEILDSDLGQLAMMGSGIGGGMAGNSGNWGRGLNWLGENVGSLGDVGNAASAAGELDPYEIFGSGASQWGGGGEYMDLGALSGLDLGGPGSSPANMGGGLDWSRAARMAGNLLAGDGGGPSGRPVGGLTGGGGGGGLTGGGGSSGSGSAGSLSPGLTRSSGQITLGTPYFSQPQLYDTDIEMAHGGLVPHYAGGKEVDTDYTSDPREYPTLRGGLLTGRGKVDLSQLGITSKWQHYAEGGHVPEFYSEGGLGNRYVKGDGDGTSDDVPAMLANGEFVIPADVVAALGNGSNDSGATVLNHFMETIREHKQAHDPKQLPPDSKGALAYLNESYEKANA